MTEKRLVSEYVTCKYEATDLEGFLNGLKRGEWVCYLLRSSCFPNRTYAGVTNDLRHRMRQHNGELIGGASATRRCRPWVLAAVVLGFDADKSAAMRFEWFTKVSHAPGAKKAFVPAHLFKPPPKELRVPSIRRRAELFKRAFDKIKTGNPGDVRMVCFDLEFGKVIMDDLCAPAEACSIIR